jgi:AcrR family transcriptional regulator
MDVRPDSLSPRKAPRQARSTATVDAIFQATLQVLRAEGVSRMTTTRVAARAGVSVGTLYQYFPHKQALLHAVLQQHLEAVATAVEIACRAQAGRPLAVMADGAVNGYLDAKIARIEASRALYTVVADLGGTDLREAASQRITDAMTIMLGSAADAEFADLDAVIFALRATLIGTVQVALERGATPDMLQTLRTELPRLCRAYLLSVATARPARRGLRNPALQNRDERGTSPPAPSMVQV